MATIVAGQYASACAPLASSPSSQGVASASNAPAGGLGLSSSVMRILLRRSAAGAGTGAVVVAGRKRGGSSLYKAPCALFDRGTGGNEKTKKDEKKFITKEQEPEQYWQTADEREGKNPMMTPLPYILILSVLSPFIILLVAFANNWIKLPVR